MWSKFMQVKTAYMAQAWRELFYAEGIAVRIVPPLESGVSDLEPREIWVPDSKTHVAAEVLRKI
jgi:hypothetical protein